MTRDHWSFDEMSLITNEGERKYLDQAERKRYLDSLDVLENEKEQTFCATLLWTGCRPSEALWLRAIQIDLAQSMIIFRSAKKRGQWKGRKFRTVPVPRNHIEWMNEVHDIEYWQAQNDHGASVPLWGFCRTTGWSKTRKVCEAADIQGIKGCARGLRHGFGVRAATTLVEPSLLQKMMGHESYATTACYLDVIGPEQCAIASRMWHCTTES